MCLLLPPRLSLFSTMAYGGGSDIPPRLLKFFSILLLTHHALALHVAQSRTGEPMIFEKSSSGFQPVAEEPEILSRERRHAQTSKEIDHWVSTIFNPVSCLSWNRCHISWRLSYLFGTRHSDNTHACIICSCGCLILIRKMNSPLLYALRDSSSAYLTL